MKTENGILKSEPHQTPLVGNMNFFLTFLLFCVREVRKNRQRKLHRRHRTVWGYHMVEGRDGVRRDLDRLERYDCVKLLNFNKAKCQVLNLGWSNPRHTHRLGEEVTGSMTFKCL